MPGFYDDDWVEQEMLAAELAEHRYQRNLANHPDCIDPDHPGCAGCEDEYES
jgi:hypothetical protein